MAPDIQKPTAGVVHKHAERNLVIGDPLGIDLLTVRLEPDLCFVRFGSPALGLAMLNACVLLVIWQCCFRYLGNRILRSFPQP